MNYDNLFIYLTILFSLALIILISIQKGILFGFVIGIVIVTALIVFLELNLEEIYYSIISRNKVKE